MEYSIKLKQSETDDDGDILMLIVAQKLLLDRLKALRKRIKKVVQNEI